MLKYGTVREIVEIALHQKKKISEIVILDQQEQLQLSEDLLYSEMRSNFKVMQESILQGIKSEEKSASGLSGGDAFKLNKALSSGKTFGGSLFTGVLVKALAVSEYNASMGKIVAAPTAGSCGIIPAVLIGVMENKNIPEKDIVMSLFTAAAIGMVISNRASISGAEGGCQAECGSASAMAAAALAEVLGGTPLQIENACAIALKNILGLVCDPVAGLVEVPCVKRNASGAANALTAAELALAGIDSKIPADEVIDSMKAIGKTMPEALRETSKGGLASTPTGMHFAAKFSG